ncbi:hypothetical protein D3C75_1161050 [compost metagenome]
MNFDCMLRRILYNTSWELPFRYLPHPTDGIIHLKASLTVKWLTLLEGEQCGQLLFAFLQRICEHLN